MPRRVGPTCGAFDCELAVSDLVLFCVLQCAKPFGIRTSRKRACNPSGMNTSKNATLEVLYNEHFRKKGVGGVARADHIGPRPKSNECSW